MLHKKVKAIRPLLIGLCFTPLLHADPISNLTCQTANGSTFSSPVYYFELGGGSAGSAYLALDLSTFSRLLSSVSAKTVYPTCELSQDGTSVVWSGATITYAEADGSGLGTSPPIFYAVASLSYASSTYNGVPGSLKGVPGMSGK